MTEPRPVASSAKNIIIIILLCIVAVQGVMLLSGPDGQKATPQKEQEREAAGNELRVTDAALDMKSRRELRVVFNQPVGDPAAGPLDPAQSLVSLKPHADGQWLWTNPYRLAFLAAQPLRYGTVYTVELDAEKLAGPDMQFVGDDSLQIATGDFRVVQITLQPQPQHGDPADKTRVGGFVEFNAQVDPEILARNLTLARLSGNSTVPLAVTSTWIDSHLGFVSDPVDKTGPPRTYELRIGPELTPYDSDVQLLQPATKQLTLTWDPVLHVEKVFGQGVNEPEIVLEFSAPIDGRELKKHLEIQPQTDFHVTADGRTAILAGNFTPGKTYGVTVRKGFVALDKAELTGSTTAQAALPDLQPRLELGAAGLFLSRNGYRSLALNTVNVNAVDVYVDRVYRNNIAPMLTLGYYGLMNGQGWTGGVNHAFGDTIAQQRVQINAPYNQKYATRLNLGPFIDGREPGIYRVVTTLPGEYSGPQRWVMLTDMGVVTKQFGDGLLVSLTSFSTLEPVAGARVTILDNQNQALAWGETDAQGIWRMDGLYDMLKNYQPFLLVAEKGEDMSMLSFPISGTDMTGLDVAGVETSAQGYTAYMYGERDIYRPGETAQGMALIRDAALQPVGPMALRLAVTGPQGREAGVHAVQADRQGRAQFSLNIPEYALTGAYTVQLLAGETAIGEYRYQVEEFVPDRIKVQITPQTADPGPGEELAFDVASSYFFGPPAAGMAVDARVRLAQAPFAPTEYPGYVFGDPEKQFDDRQLLQTESRLSAAGEASFRAQIPESLQPPAALEAVITARVREKGGRGVAARQSVTVHAYERYVGLKQLPKNGYESGATIPFAYVLVTPQGQPAQPAAVTAELVHDRWQTVLRQDPAGGWRYESVRDSKVVDRRELAVAASGSFSFTAPNVGSYRVVVRDPQTGAAAQLQFYAGGWGYSPWAVENPARMELVPDKEEYGPKETAKLQVRAPFPGRLLVTVERNGVYDVITRHMNGNTATVDIPLQQLYAPNVYVTAMVLRKAADVEPGEPGRAVGVVSLAVDREANKLRPIIAAPEQVKPETEVQVSAQTAPGATVTLAAVDEGVLQLIQQKTPAPFDHFYAKRKLAVDTYDIYSMLLPEVGPQAEGPAGGGQADMMGQFVRTEGLRRVKPVAFWSGPLTAGIDGKVKWSFTPPDFQGALRIMAVAATDRQFGAADAQVVVKSPLLALPTFPRFLAPDETVQVPVTIRNDTGAAGEFAASLTARGAAQAPGDGQTVTLDTGAEKTVYFDLATGPNTGPVFCTVTVQGRDEEYETSTELHVRPALPARTLASSGTLEPGETVLEPDVAQFRSGELTRSLYIGATPLMRFGGDLQDLIAYPYGCLEQTVSQAFPLIRYEWLAQALDPQSAASQEPAGLVQRAIGRVRSMQLSSGAFALWPGGDQPHDWATVYALHFLADARSAGFGLGMGLLEPAVTYVTGLVRNLENRAGRELQLKSYGLYALALAGAAERGVMDQLRDGEASKLAAGDRAMLAAAYAQLGDMQSVQNLLAAPLEPAVTERHSGGNLSSPLRQRAMILLALLQAAPDDERISAMADELVRRLGQAGPLTTQEAAFGFLALGRYFSSLSMGGPFRGQVFLGATLLGDFASNAPLRLQSITGDASLRVVMDPGANGKAFYGLNERGVPPRDAYSPVEDGLEISVEWLQRDGAAVDMADIAQGDLLIARIQVRSLSGPVENVAVSLLLPAGFEVENPRLATTEQITPGDGAQWRTAYLDIRDDRALFFGDLPADTAVQHQVLLRAVTPGRFTVPPVQIEAMYQPQLRASGAVGEAVVNTVR